MADATSVIFNRQAAEKLRSPDDLDKYVRVTNPSVWIVLFACIALLIGLLSWGIFGTVSTSVNATGLCVDGEPICFLSAENAGKVRVGDTANVGGKILKVASISDVPVSRNELHALVKSDYLVSSLVEGEWAYVVHFEGDSSGLKDSVPIAVDITTEQIAPISLILGRTK